jgi:hypothetical protein
MNYKVISVIVILVPGISFSQVSTESQPDFSGIMEIILSVEGDNADPEQVIESLRQLSENPLNINTASKEDLGSLLFLSTAEIDSLLAYRLKHNNFLSLEELYYVEGLSPETAGLLQPFLTVEQVSVKGKPGIKNLLVNSKKSFVTRYSRQIEKPEGYDSSTGAKNNYLGGPGQYMMRFRITVPDNFSAGFTAEKDKGEPLLWAPSRNFYGFDHYSGHIALMNRGIIKNLTLGDYKILFGQGLVLGNGFYFGKSSEPIASVRSRAPGIRPYSGSGESGFFRGAASEIRFGRFSVTSFISYKKVDSRTDNETISEHTQTVIRSFSTSGLHRTISEIENRKNTTEFTTGYHLEYKNAKQNFSAASSGIYTKYSLVYQENPVYYNQFDFYGQDQLTMGLDYNYYHRKFNVFGEAAVSGKQGLGLTQGIIGNLSKNIETAVHLRYYGPSFHSFYGNPFRESSSVGNESGIYWGIRILPVRNIIINAYLDVFRFPWLRYNLKSPSAGNEILLKIAFNPGKNFELYGQGIRKIMDAASPGVYSGISGTIPGIKQQFRIQFSWNPGNHLQIRSRIQLSTYKISIHQSSGMAACQDLGWKFKYGSFQSRFLWFRTDDYLNRQFVFEPGVLYDYQVPSYYGKGVRVYLMTDLKATRYLHFRASAGRTIYGDVNQIGTGTEMIPGNHRTDFQLLCELKF